MISAELGQSLEKFITRLVKSGRYGSKSEVLREGVRLIQEREARLTALDAAIARGLDDARTGRSKPAGDAFAELQARYTVRGKRG